MPGWKQAWPIVAACWSPATPEDRDLGAEQRLLGDAEIGGAVLHFGQQRCRDAQDLQQLGVPFVRARCCRPACARRWSRRWRVSCRRSGARSGSCRSCRPAARRFSARWRAPFTLSSSQAILVPEKYGSSSSPVFCENFFSSPCFFSLWQSAEVRRSCQTMALWIGLPVALSQMTTVSRWLVMPIAAMSEAPRPAVLQRLAAGRDARSARSPRDRARPSRMPDSAA